MTKEIIKMKLRIIFKKYIYIKLGICIGLNNHWFKNPIAMRVSASDSPK